MFMKKKAKRLSRSPNLVAIGRDSCPVDRLLGKLGDHRLHIVPITMTSTRIFCLFFKDDFLMKSRNSFYLNIFEAFLTTAEGLTR